MGVPYFFVGFYKAAVTFIKEIMSQEPAPAPDEAPLLLSLLRHGLQSFLIVIIGGSIAVVFLLNWVNPTTTYYIWQEKQRLGNVEALWTPMDDIAPVLARSVVAAEDANFCLHWGFDLAAIRTALADGGRRGASTLTQQTVKNVFLWPARSWVRKAFEAILTPLVEVLWPKKRIVEIYLNVAEFGTGVFGVHAASQYYFRVEPKNLTAVQAARLAAILPSPKTRSASQPTSYVRARAVAIADGAATILKDQRSACFED